MSRIHDRSSQVNPAGRPQHPNDWVDAQPLAFEPKAVLRVLVKFDGPQGCFPSRTVLLAALGCSKTLLTRCLAYLEENGYIERVQRRRANGSRSSDEYLIRYEYKVIEPLYAYKKPHNPEGINTPRPVTQAKDPRPVGSTTLGLPEAPASARGKGGPEASIETSSEASVSSFPRESVLSEVEGTAACPSGGPGVKRPGASSADLAVGQRHGDLAVATRQWLTFDGQDVDFDCEDDAVITRMTAVITSLLGSGLGMELIVTRLNGVMEGDFDALEAVLKAEEYAAVQTGVSNVITTRQRA